MSFREYQQTIEKVFGFERMDKVRGRVIYSDGLLAAVKSKGFSPEEYFIDVLESAALVSSLLGVSFPDELPKPMEEKMGCGVRVYGFHLAYGAQEDPVSMENIKALIDCLLGVLVGYAEKHGLNIEEVVQREIDEIVLP